MLTLSVESFQFRAKALNSGARWLTLVVQTIKSCHASAGAGCLASNPGLRGPREPPSALALCLHGQHARLLVNYISVYLVAASVDIHRISVIHAPCAPISKRSPYFRISRSMDSTPFTFSCCVWKRTPDIQIGSVILDGVRCDELVNCDGSFYVARYDTDRLIHLSSCNRLTTYHYIPFTEIFGS